MMNFLMVVIYTSKITIKILSLLVMTMEVLIIVHTIPLIANKGKRTEGESKKWQIFYLQVAPFHPDLWHICRNSVIAMGNFLLQLVPDLQANASIEKVCMSFTFIFTSSINVVVLVRWSTFGNSITAFSIGDFFAYNFQHELWGSRFSSRCNQLARLFLFVHIIFITWQLFMC